MEETLILFSLRRRWTGNGFFNIKDAFAESFVATNIRSASSRLVSQVHMIAWENRKKKYLMCQIPIKMLKQHTIPNSNLQNLKIYSSKGCRKTSQRWIMYAAKTAILRLRIFSRRYHFRLWAFASTGKYFQYWHWRVFS